MPNRTSNGTLTWNPDRFPNGYFALGDYIHGLGLKFGVYSDAGVQMCMTGTPAQVGSLCKSSMFYDEVWENELTISIVYEKEDLDTFVSWGADLLKCISPPNLPIQ